MPRFYFDITANGVETRDDVGRLFYDAEAAGARAEGVLHELAGENAGSCAVTVRDEAGVAIVTKFVVQDG